MAKYNHAARKTPRAVVDQTAWIADEDGNPLCSCIMIDVSAGGAKLVVGVGDDVPSVFVLVLSRDGRVRRWCKTAWRDARKIGAQFLVPNAKPAELTQRKSVEETVHPNTPAEAEVQAKAADGADGEAREDGQPDDQMPR